MFLASKSIEDDPGTAVVEGTSDEHPIVCDDTTESFRALCRVLYVGFNEFEAGVDKTIANFTVEEFAHIASLAHKYQCEKIEPWALNLFERKLGELNNARQPGVPPLPRELLEYFIRTSIRCGWSGSPVRGTSEDLLLETIFHPSGDSSIPKQSQEGRSLSVVLEFSESIGSNELKARAYYTFLASVGWCLAPRIRSSRLIEVPNSYHPRAYSRAINLDTLDDNEAVPFQKWDSLGALTDEQKTCLIHGLHLISALRKELQGIPSVVSPCSCLRHPQPFRGAWEATAQELGKQPTFDDPKLFLNEMRRRLSFNSQCYSVCGVVRVQSSIDRFLSNFNTWIANIFSD